MSREERVEIRENVLLAPYSTFKIGGMARFFVEVKKIEELEKAIRYAEQRRLFDPSTLLRTGFAQGKNPPWRIFAGGSNVVFPDEGFSGLVIKINFGKMKVFESERRIEAEAGVALKDLIKKAILKGWAGLETLSGIPGTVGGAVYGNAGAYGQSISGVIVSVTIYDTEKNEEKVFSREECGFQYRHSIFKENGSVITKIVFEFQSGDKRALQARSKEIIKTREKKYKPGIMCPGSFFKNVLVKDLSEDVLAKIDKAKIIEGKVPAGYLLEQVRAKGMREGGIYIADFHGNLFVNDGRGKAADVKKLAVELKRRVFERFGVGLEEEVQYF